MKALSERAMRVVRSEVRLLLREMGYEDQQGSQRQEGEESYRGLKDKEKRDLTDVIKWFLKGNEEPERWMARELRSILSIYIRLHRDMGGDEGMARRAMSEILRDSIKDVASGMNMPMDKAEEDGLIEEIWKFARKALPR